METTRKPLEEHRKPSADEAGSPMVKKLKTAPSARRSVLTFKLSHSPVQVQVLSDQTIFNLVDIICQETTVGMNEGVHDHMWDIYIPNKQGMFNSSDLYVDSIDCPMYDGPLYKASQTKLGELELPLYTTMTLKYDYGSTVYYSIQLVEETPYDGETGNFPRRKPIADPTGMVEFKTDLINLNTMFPTLNKFIIEAESISLNFFQPGRKHNYGLVERENEGVRHMIFLPVRPGGDLHHYLHCFDYASQFKYSTFKDEKWECPNYTWYSMVVFPYHVQMRTHQKWFSDQEQGFCEAKIAPSCKHPQHLNDIFPKVATLAGYNKKDKTVKKGWFTYKDGTLRICSGKAKVDKGGSPKFTAFVGLDQHEPDSAESIVAEVQLKIKSLHHLICAVEGLLMSI